MPRKRNALEEIASAFLMGGLVGLSEHLGVPMPSTSDANSPYRVLGIRQEAPLEVAEAAYRVLAKSAHPDAGGSEAAMKRLNAAIVAVRKERT